VLADGAYAAAALSAEIERHPQLAARDRALMTELVYGALRAGRYLDGRFGQLSERGIADLDAPTRAVLWVAAHQILFLDRVPVHAAVNAAVESIKRASGPKKAAFANAILRRLDREAEDSKVQTVSDAIVAGAPRWLVRSLDRALGEGEGVRYLAAGPVPPPIALRVRDGEAESWMTKLGEALGADKIARGTAARAAILVKASGDPRRFPGVASGELVVQEEGSQVVAEALGAKPGERVLDACAGRGNKALALLDHVGPTGQVDAADLHESKLERLVESASSLGLAVGATYAVDWSVGAGDVPLDAYDRVLVDAPCSGVGTLRRRPEILLQRTKEGVLELSALQSSILANAARTAKQGGTVVLAVCSVLAEEMEDVLARAEGLELREVRRLSPLTTGTDGYAIATLTKR
jgi:16S rRNA (cytosine967-C5)-methyltransferase